MTGTPTHKANFGLNVYRSGVTRFEVISTTTTLSLVNRSRASTITTFQVTGNTATISGTCTRKFNGLELPCTFNATVVDNGYPGKGRDTFEISGTGLISEWRHDSAAETSRSTTKVRG